MLNLLCPSLYVDSILSLDLEALRSRGTRGLLLDLDNTLVPWQSLDLQDEVSQWARKACDLGFRLCIISNTRSPKRLRALAERLGIPYTRQASKPSRRGFREAMRLLELGESEVAVIGDQIFTDILGGNRLGIHTILVKPIAKREFIGTKLSRFFEGMVLRTLSRRGMLNTASAMREQSADAGRQMKTEL